MEPRPQARLLLHDEAPDQRPRRRANLPRLPSPPRPHPRQNGKPRVRAVGPRSTVSEGSFEKLVVVGLVGRPAAGVRLAGRGGVRDVAVVGGAAVKLTAAWVGSAVEVIVRLHLFDKGQYVHLFVAIRRGTGTGNGDGGVLMSCIAVVV